MAILEPILVLSWSQYTNNFTCRQITEDDHVYSATHLEGIHEKA